MCMFLKRIEKSKEIFNLPTLLEKTYVTGTTYNFFGLKNIGTFLRITRLRSELCNSYDKRCTSFRLYKNLPEMALSQYFIKSWNKE